MSALQVVHRAFVVAEKIGGGIPTFMWALDADPLLLEVLFLASNRRSVEESLGSIPADEYPTRDMLEGYRTTRTPDENLAWSDLFPELCAWLADRERKRKEKEIHAARTRH